MSDDLAMMTKQGRSGTLLNKSHWIVLYSQKCGLEMITPVHTRLVMLRLRALTFYTKPDLGGEVVG